MADGSNAQSEPDTKRGEDMPALEARDGSFVPAQAVAGHRNILLLSLLLLALVLWTFLPAINNGFVGYDDADYVTSNYHVRTGLNWENIRWAFANVESGNWHPMTWLSHMLDCECFGLNPSGHHLTSLILHALNALLVFRLFLQWTGG